MPKSQPKFERETIIQGYKLTQPFSLNIPRCRHLKVNGTQCGSPALKDHRFCYFHQRWHERKIVINRLSRVPHVSGSEAVKKPSRKLIDRKTEQGKLGA